MIGECRMYAKVKAPVVIWAMRKTEAQRERLSELRRNAVRPSEAASLVRCRNERREA